MSELETTSRLDASLTRLEAKLDESVSSLHAKIDKLSEVITAIRLLEERVTQQGRSIERAFTKLEDHDATLIKIYHRNAVADKSIAAAERILWILLTIGLSVGTYYLTGVKP